MDELKYKDGKFTVNGADVSEVSATTEINESVQELSANTSQFSVIDNPEYIEVKLDSDGKVIEGTRADGTIEHNSNHEFKQITLGDGTDITGITDLEKALKADGFNPGGTCDWTDYRSNDGNNPLCIPEPRCAKINIHSDFDLTQLSKFGKPGAQAGVNYDIPTQVEFWDMQGNYFKKWALISGQGSSSLSLPKKSIAFDFFDSEVGGNAFAIKFGDWIPQDSFHCKAFYTDFFKGVSICGYKLADQMYRTRSVYEDRPWKKALLAKYNYQNGVYNNTEFSDLDLQYDTGARCVPDGFPVIIYQNGKFYGIFAMALKKHRDNYHQKKDNAKHIHLDGAWFDRKNAEGETTHHSIWLGILDWTVFEVRNPKYLVYKEPVNGSYEYDADIKQAEIAGLNEGETANTWTSGDTFNMGDIVELDNRMYQSMTNENVGNDPSKASYGSKVKNVYDKADGNWIEITFTNEVKQSIINLSKRIPACKAASTLDEKRAIMDSYFDKDNLIDWCNHTNFIYNVDSTHNNTQWVTYDGVKWFACIYDLDIAFGIGGSTGISTTPPNKSNIVGSDSSFPGAQIWTCYSDDAKARYKECKEKGVFTYENIASIINSWVTRVGKANYALEYAKWTEAPCNRDGNLTYKLYPNTGGYYDNIYRLMSWLQVRSKNVDEFMGVNN